MHLHNKRISNSSAQKGISRFESTGLSQIKSKVKSTFDCSGERFGIISNVRYRRNQISQSEFLNYFFLSERLSTKQMVHFFRKDLFCNVYSEVNNVQVKCPVGPTIDHLQQS